MPNIPDAANKVPLMFQAQTNGRCQLQRLGNSEQDIERWASEWIEKVYPDAPEFGSQVRTRSSTLSWRFVTNGGQDDNMIRPVIGARGWPFYPGSSMKGIFRHACTSEQAERYCGKGNSSGDFEPGILRFHGGYPTDGRWRENLVDIVHPQQDWQVKQDQKLSGAFVQISLYKPKLKFGISTIIHLEEAEWKTIWDIWEKALSTGIGCRVCAGYGQPRTNTGDVIYWVQIKGEGAASKLLDGKGEFRPNMFRATLRSHALRIFGGLTDEDTADRLVEGIFGSVQEAGTVGLLGMRFKEITLKLDKFDQSSYDEPIYEVEGYLIWLLTQNLSDTKRQALQTLVKVLTQFGMLLGGFGKSWRRPDHRLFYPEYYEGQNKKPQIGCHWQFTGERSLLNEVPVRTIERVGSFIDRVREAASCWMQLQEVTPNPTNMAPWREAWHPDTVEVWGRLANESGDCEAIRWLHGPYRAAIPQAKIREGSIYHSSITGQMGNIGRLWLRMYPLVQLRRSHDNPQKPIPIKTKQYFELLSIFPDDSTESKQFLNFLDFEQRRFQRLWPMANS